MAISCIIFLAGAILLWGLLLPYVKAWEIGALEFFAKNHIFYGLRVTKGIPVKNFINGYPNYYRSHPPLVPFLISLFFRIFGTYEWSARLVPIIFSILGLLFFYLLIESISNKQTALFASVIMVFMPMFSYYGRIVNYESVTLGFSMIFLYSFIKLIHTQRRIFWVNLIITTILGVLSDWPFLLLFPALFLYVKVTQRGIKPYIRLTILACAVAIGIILFFNYATASSIKTQIQLFINRCQYQTVLGAPGFYQILIKRLLLNFTPFGCLFLFLWLIRLFRKRSLINGEVNLFAGVLFVFGFSLILIAPQAAYVHVWALQYLTPAMALIMALAVIKFTRQWRVFFILLFIIFSLTYLAKLHFIKYNGPYETGKTVAKISSQEDILYTNVISPVSFYSGVETHFFSIEEGDPESFIANKLPRFVFIIRYAIEPKFDFDKISSSLSQKGYGVIYDRNGVVLWGLHS